MGALDGVTLARAGVLIGGDEPLSKRTISAMITRGLLEAYGVRAGRRVTIRSIRAYQEGRLWQDETNPTSDGGPEPGTSPRLRVVGRKRTTRRQEADTTPSAAIHPRQPKNGWQS